MDGETFARELLDDVKDFEFPAIEAMVTDKVIRPDLPRMHCAHRSRGTLGLCALAAFGAITERQASLPPQPIDAFVDFPRKSVV